MGSIRPLILLTVCVVFSLYLCSCGPNKPPHTPEGAASTTKTVPTKNPDSIIATVPQSLRRKIHIVVVAVPHFSISDYNSDEIKTAFENRCAELGTYFADSLGKDNIELHPYCTEQLTTREAT